MWFSLEYTLEPGGELNIPEGEALSSPPATLSAFTGC